MYFLLLGLVGLALKYLQIGPVAAFNWWLVLSPFLAAIVWWAWADAFGYTEKMEMKKMTKRKEERLARQHEALGNMPFRRK